MGEFKGDLRNGHGIYYYGDGGRYDGVFKNEAMVKGKGVYVKGDGSNVGGFDYPPQVQQDVVGTAEGGKKDECRVF